tara:strand:- start:250 stop:402 length:153 start_codon:yes stop_codon:yes gene_type:complete
MKTLEEIIENNIEILEKNKKEFAEFVGTNEMQITINVLQGLLNEYKNQNK